MARRQGRGGEGEGEGEGEGKAKAKGKGTGVGRAEGMTELQGNGRESGRGGKGGGGGVVGTAPQGGWMEKGKSDGERESKRKGTQGRGPQVEGSVVAGTRARPQPVSGTAGEKLWSEGRRTRMGQGIGLTIGKGGGRGKEAGWAGGRPYGEAEGGVQAGEGEGWEGKAAGRRSHRGGKAELHGKGEGEWEVSSERKGTEEKTWDRQIRAGKRKARGGEGSGSGRGRGT